MLMALVQIQQEAPVEEPTSLIELSLLRQLLVNISSLTLWRSRIVAIPAVCKTVAYGFEGSSPSSSTTMPTSTRGFSVRAWATGTPHRGRLRKQVNPPCKVNGLLWFIRLMVDLRPVTAWAADRNRYEPPERSGVTRWKLSVKCG